MVTRNNAKRDLAQFLQVLDARSRAILHYLWWHRHAEISQLRNAGDKLEDSEVLYRLKEVINKKSQDLWGRHIVDFEQSKIDPITGEKILFSWWYIDEDDLPVSGEGGALVDVFNEKERIIIIAQIPVSIDLNAPDIQLKNNILRVEFKKIRA
jgi:hypothetical protein